MKKERRQEILQKIETMESDAQDQFDIMTQFKDGIWAKDKAKYHKAKKEALRLSMFAQALRKNLPEVSEEEE